MELANAEPFNLRNGHSTLFTTLEIAYAINEHTTDI